MTLRTRGRERERTLTASAYFSERYFSMQQLCAFAHQLHQIWRMKPANVIEIGVGNGFVSSYLKRAGVPVTTVDINPDLQPDICADLSDLPGLLSGKYDLVVCCEVLEHMPFYEFGANLDYLRAVGDRLLLTLPSAHRTYGFGGLLTLPRLRVLCDFHVSIPIKGRVPAAHYWELGSEKECSRAVVVKMLKERYGVCKAGRLPLQPYHWLFECS